MLLYIPCVLTEYNDELNDVLSTKFRGIYCLVPIPLSWAVGGRLRFENVNLYIRFL